MRQLLGGLVIVVLLVVAVGVWRGWFGFSMHDTDSDKPRIEMDIDKGKMKSDTENAKKKLQEATEKAKGATENK